MADLLFNTIQTHHNFVYICGHFVYVCMCVADLLSLLNWKSKRQDVHKYLVNLRNVDVIEIVKVKTFVCNVAVLKRITSFSDCVKFF